MKKYLMIFLPLMFFIGCDDNSNDDDSSSSSPYDGTWQVTFIGEYENADCSGSVDSTTWAFAALFGLVQTLEIDGDSYTMSMTMMGETEQTTGTFSEEDGDICVDGECLPMTWETDGEVWSQNITSDAYCEDYDEVELPDYTDQPSCEDSGNYWYDESCVITVWTKQ